MLILCFSVYKARLSPVRLFNPSVKSDWNSGDCNFIVNRYRFRRHSLLQLQLSTRLCQGLDRCLNIWRESHQPHIYRESRHAGQLNLKVKENKRSFNKQPREIHLSR
jgi:hypothetical protein